MLKKTRLKQEKKALDELEKNDPEGYTEKLRQLERDRIQVDMLHIEGCWYFAEWNGTNFGVHSRDKTKYCIKS